MIDKHKSILSLHASVLLFSGTALFSKLIPLPAWDITCFRAFVAALALFSFLILAKQRIRLHRIQDYFIAILLGLLVGFHWVTYFQGMQLSTVAIGIIAFFSYPVITILLEPLFSKQLPKFTDLFAGLIVFFGIYLMMPEFSIDNHTTQGILISILSALLFTLRNILHKHKFSQYSGQHAMLYQTIVASAVLVIGLETSPTELTMDSILLLLLVGTVFTALPHAMFAGVFRHLKVKTVSLISCMQPLYATILAILLLQEIPDWKTVLGGILVVTTAIIETRLATKQSN
ncbi:DMT family transporter [Algicola sagamiensis]|uniref:DMT family transporter n=1 Tax=Algicola sagamiensis TaxID=163869 RepID=UPI000365F97F|nr:DMT family transporter [Algicola sagamiensis]